MHFWLKFSWLREPGGEMGGPAASAVPGIDEGSRNRRIEARPRAAPSPQAARRKFLLCSPSPVGRTVSLSAPPGQASTQDRHSTHRSLSTFLSRAERQAVGQAASHRPQFEHESGSKRILRREWEEKSPRKVPTGHSPSQYGRPRKTDQAAREAKKTPAASAAGVVRGAGEGCG